MSGLSARERSLGCLFGGAIGDAFGYAVEFMDLEAIKERFGKNGLTEPAPSGGLYRISDDTQMTLLTADGLLTGETRFCCRGIAASPADYAYPKYRHWAMLQGFPVSGQTHGSWLFSDPAMCSRRAPGNTCISDLCANEIPARPGDPRNGSKGCGGLMRAAPAGIAAHRFPESNIRAMMWGEEVAAATHGHPLGWMTAAIMADIICRIMEGCGLEESLSMEMADCERRYSGSRFLGEMTGMVRRAMSLADSGRDDASCMAELGEGWVAEETLAMAVFSCVRHQDDVKACLRCAVNVTGDSDSIGSVAGNILGALVGFDEVGRAFDIGRVECGDLIRVTAEDLASGCPTDGRVLEDENWEDKYVRRTNPYNSRRWAASVSRRFSPPSRRRATAPVLSLMDGGDQLASRSDERRLAQCDEGAVQ